MKNFKYLLSIAMLLLASVGLNATMQKFICYAIRDKDSKDGKAGTAISSSAAGVQIDAPVIINKKVDEPGYHKGYKTDAGKIATAVEDILHHCWLLGGQHGGGSSAVFTDSGILINSPHSMTPNKKWFTGKVKNYTTIEYSGK